MMICDEIKGINMEKIIKLAACLKAFSEGERDQWKTVVLELCETFHIEEKADELFGLFSKKIDGLINTDENIAVLLKDVDKLFVALTDQIKANVKKYLKGEINEEEFLKAVLNGGTNIMALVMHNVNHYTEKQLSITLDFQNAAAFSWGAVAFICLSMAYQNVKKALKEYNEAIEERQKIEMQCAEAINAIVRYRMDLNICCERYFCQHYMAFDRGLTLMDQSIAIEDSDGFIYGNVEIQKILKHPVQFQTQQEFDQLMADDGIFKL